MKEKTIEQRLVKAVKARGGICPKWVSPGFDGVPDRLVFLPGRHFGLVEVKAPGEVTVCNMRQPRIEAQTLPKFGLGGVLFISDNKALEITPDGKITPVAEGIGKVTVVATGNTELYEQIQIAVVPPRVRLSSDGGIRLDGSGNIRLT